MMENTDIVFEDNHVLVIVKPPNLLSQRDNTGDISIVDIYTKYIKEKYNKLGNVYLGLVHRLDRPVGGLMVLAKTSKAASRLSASLQKQELKRSYLAIVEGDIQSQDLVNYLLQDKFGNIVNSSKEDSSAKYASLRVEKLAYRDNKSLCKIMLNTGRKHQIRAQLSIAGFPILYDMRYGRGIAGKQIALWGAWINFVHPTTKQNMSFHSVPYTSSFKDFSTEINNILE